MPLFNYQCIKCEQIIEKFQHSVDDKLDIICECGCEEFNRLFGMVNNRTILDARDMLKNKILPDAERIRKNIKNGKDNDFIDIYGEK